MDFKQMAKHRESIAKEIQATRLFVYVGTAGFFAAAMSDFMDGASASAVANLGLILILVRSYYLAPIMLCKLRNGDPEWLESEERYCSEHYPWVGYLGNAGWLLLGLGVFLQFLFGIS